MKTITFTSLKGGVGRSMTLYNLISCMSDRGFKVLAIDGDPQGNLSFAFAGQKHEQGLYEVLTGDISTEDAIIQPYRDTEYDSLKNIYLLPCNYNLFLYEKDSNNSQQIFELKKKLEVLESLNFDYVFFDTNPSLSFILASIFAYVQTYVGIFDMTRDAMDGFDFLENVVIRYIKEKANPNLYCGGIILNNKNRTTNYGTQFIDSAKARYGRLLFDTIISESVANKESRLLNLPMIAYLNRHQSTLQYADLTAEFLKRMGSEN